LVWNEVGESLEDRDRVLYELDQECLDVYKRKLDQATNSRDLLIQALDDSKIELARLLSALGEKAIARTVSGYFFIFGFLPRVIIIQGTLLQESLEQV
jgi:Ase1/PRC1/MAP65 family protein